MVFLRPLVLLFPSMNHHRLRTPTNNTLSMSVCLLFVSNLKENSFPAWGCQVCRWVECLAKDAISQLQTWLWPQTEASYMFQLITLMSGIMSFLLKGHSWCVISCSAFNYLWKATGEQLQVWYRSRTSPSTAVFQAVLATLRMQTQIITFLLFLVTCLSVGSLKLLTGVCAFCCCSVVSFLYLCNLNKKKKQCQKAPSDLYNALFAISPQSNPLFSTISWLFWPPSLLSTITSVAEIYLGYSNIYRAFVP